MGLLISIVADLDFLDNLNTLLWYLLLLMLIAPFVIITIIVILVSRNAKNAKNAVLLREQDLMHEVELLKKSLINWSTHDCTSITSNIITQSAKLDSQRLSGLIYSIKGAPILAFSKYVNDEIAYSQIFVSSTSFDFAFKIFDKKIDIIHNMEYLGTWKAKGDILNKKKIKIGIAKHPKPITIEIHSYKHRFGDPKFDIEIFKKRIATIWIPLYQSPEQFTKTNESLKQNNSRVSIINLMQPVTYQEQKWLLALSILEVVHHSYIIK